MNSGGCAHKGKERKIVEDVHNIGHAPNRARRHLDLDLNAPAKQELEATTVPGPRVNPSPRPLKESHGRTDKHIDWASGSIGIGLDGKLKVTYSKPKPMTKAERVESERRLALNAAVHEAQECDEAYYQGRLDKLGIKRGHLPVEDQSLDTSSIEDLWVPSLW